MADIKPRGAATTMAMVEISKVPTNNGTAPKLPEDPAWSARMAICGLQWVPNKNSAGETDLKNRIDSNKTEITIPKVVSTATRELAKNSVCTTLSTWLRARNSTVIWRNANAADNMAISR